MSPHATDAPGAENVSAPAATALLAKMPQVLCVDCDGTLIRSDLLQESFLRFIKDNPLGIFQVVGWFLSGRGRLKYELAKRVSIAYEMLAFNRRLLNLIGEIRNSGRKVFLVTAASQIQADQLARHLGCFDGAYGSSEMVNLKGAQKAALLVRLFGKGGFAYAGDSRADLPVWEAAGEGIVISDSKQLLARAKAANENIIAIPPELTGWGRWIQLARIHQWAKNLILFVPAITSHRVFEGTVLRKSLLAFLSFGLTASATYVLNDLLDLDHDRRHASKKQRPLANGTVGIFAGVTAAVIMLATGGGIALFLPVSFWIVLASYVVLTAAYSGWVKRLMLADSVLLGGLYALRLYAGGAATGIALSTWLLAFSIFIFFSLALAKRLAELHPLLLNKPTDQNALGGRAYTLEDIPVVTALGISSGLIGVLVLVLYINGPDVVQLYPEPKVLLLLVPLLLYWIGRIWVIARRGELLEDPVLYAVRDFRSYLIAVLALAVIAAATFLKFSR